MKLQDFLFESVETLRGGDMLLIDELEPLLEVARDRIDEWAAKIEDDPQLEGLEALDDAILEALDYFSEAVDYLQLAASEDIPELAELISARTQDALDTLRHARQQASRHNHMLSAEDGWNGQ